MKDVIDAAKAKPKGLKWGGTNVGSDDHIFTSMLSKASGTEYNFISLASGGDVVTNLLGGHVDIGSANLAEVLPQVEAKKVRILAVGSDKRIAQVCRHPDPEGIGHQHDLRTRLAWSRLPQGCPRVPGVHGRHAQEDDRSQGLEGLRRPNDQVGKFLAGAELDKYVVDFNTQIITLVTELGLVEKK